MISVSSKGIYGLAALFILARNYESGPLRIKDISSGEGIPRQYLEQLLIKLKKSGLVKSYRGKDGGYSLKKRPSEITVYEALVCLEGPMELASSTTRTGTLHFFWQRAQQEIIEIFDITLEDLIMEHDRLNNQVVYDI